MFFILQQPDWWQSSGGKPPVDPSGTAGRLYFFGRKATSFSFIPSCMLSGVGNECVCVCVCVRAC